MSKKVQYAESRIKNKVKRVSIGDNIGTVSEVSQELGLSMYLVKKAISKLESTGLIDNRGRYGIFKAANTQRRLASILDNLDWSSKAHTYLTATKMMRHGGVFDGTECCILQVENNSLNLFYVLTGYSKQFSLQAVLSTLNTPYTLDDVCKNKCTPEAFNAQENVRDFISVIVRNKNKLELK